MKINILTSQKKWDRGFNDFFPLFKWRKALVNENIQVSYFYTYNNSKLFHCDQLWVDYRFFQSYFDTTNKQIDLSPVFDFFIKAKKNVGRLVLFDSSDGSGSQCLILTQFVDVHLKKQAYKNKLEYTIDRGDKSFMCWIPDGATESNIKYYTTTEEHLHKIKLSWNVGLLDYRYFPLSYLYPIGTSKIFSEVYKTIKFTEPNFERSILTSYRGTIHPDTRYSFQRKIILDRLAKEDEKYTIKTGKAISKNAYVNEIKNSVFSISPFGWGEVCYRDFEIILSGSIFIKPNMDHLETFPNLYLKNETYLSLNWDLSNLDDIMTLMKESSKDYLPLAKNALDLFLEFQNSELLFLNHFKSIIE